MKIFIKTYGCALNRADSNIIKSVLVSRGMEIVDEIDKADVAIINTCTVKNPTEQKILYLLEKLEGKKNIVVTGCMSSANRDDIEKVAPNASIVTATNIPKIAEAVEAAYNGGKVVFDKYSVNDRLVFLNPGKRIISEIPISEGCLSNCTFCETRFARGALHSFPESTIIAAIKKSVENGAKEIEITSQDIGAYGLDKGTNIARLMEKIIDIEGNFKVRIGMMNPEHFGKYASEFIEALKDDKFYKFIHLPIQSGSDKVLKEMNRNYTTKEVMEYIELIRERLESVLLETDLIVGYPTETYKDFKETIDFTKKARFDVSNISKFGARPHAPASKLEQISPKEINKRSVELTREVREMQHNINEKFIGRVQKVIITEVTERSINGRMDDYRQVVIANSANMIEDLQSLLGTVQKAEIYGVTSHALYGRLLLNK
ncbi:MAG: tRNA (N(6)-L-threonylcarbamoyladenosine(37)-C(2))-methylthiotransferase [Candidatus Micrarchaeia archaeon]